MEDNTTTVTEAKERPVGALQASINRNRNQIRADRAEQISDDVRLEFRRKVEDAYREIRRLKAAKGSHLDLSPNNAMSMINAKEFDALAFADKMGELAMEIYKAELKYRILREEYVYIIGEEPNVEF